MFKPLQTLHSKLSLALFALLCLAGLLLVPLTLFATRAYIEEVDQNLNRGLASDLASHLAERRLLPRDFATNERAQAESKAEISRLMVLNPDIEIYILDVSGRILASSKKKAELQETRIAIEPVRSFVARNRPLPVRGDDPLHPGRSKVFSAAQTSAAQTGAAQSDHLAGYVYIILGGQAYESIAGMVGRSYALRGSLWLLVGTLAFVFSGGVLMFRVLTRRLRVLTTRVEAFEAQFGPLPDSPGAQPEAQTGRDEIERLQGVVTRMSLRIRTQVEARERSDAQRRELMGNISHDLRTPLAALQGFLETLQMKRDLSPEEQQAYLSTAMRRAQQLSNLIAALFELAKLDSAEAQPQIEAFSLAELVQDEVQQFQMRAQKKGVRLEAAFPQDLPFVKGDLGMIERVLENLLDNALRHTPSGGLIRVSLRLDAGAVVEVMDTGEGIRPEDLPRIFERTFRAANGPSEGAGLGLAITRRICELHGTDIEVRNTPGGGTTFSFRLPVAG